MGNWYLPITLVPGIGLLILSTSNLMLTLTNEIGVIIPRLKKEEDIIIYQKINQLKRLNLTMVLLYIAVACLVLSSLIGGITENLQLSNNWDIYCSIVGIIFILSSLYLLIIFSLKALSIRQNQFLYLLENKTKKTD